MVQREVGERWSAPAGRSAPRGSALKLALLADAEVVFTIPRTVFHPVPNVDSVMVRLRVTTRPTPPTGPGCSG
jgi:16S rRNA (adenine1518-N6/adenine1519-N6)-dimethyltransferase